MINLMQLPQIILKEKLPLDSFQVSSVDSSLKIEPEFQQKLTQNWKEFVAEAESKGNSLWDGTYYRLENIDELNQGKKEFKFSELKYSTLRGITQEAIVNSNIFKQYPIYTCATAGLILTNDNFYVFGSRKDNTMHTQSMDFIGGGLQSDELTLNSGIDIQSNM
ncbi:hypothetical protein KC669_05030, partial [Candidatus Dojkabacteria bacterium]|nr:hypothetical protein [Candidatus Dojkabacteria bacterium]